MSAIKQIQKKHIPSLSDLPKIYFEKGKNQLHKFIMIKLNGGLGTSMGCKGPKSLIRVTNNDTFFDIINKQYIYDQKVYQTSFPIYFMNSFNTDQETKSALNTTKMKSFLQDRIPRLVASTKLPFEANHSSSAWCPPGHGNVFLSLLNRGILEHAMNKGQEYAFISNSDNLGATLDLSILGYMVEKKSPFIMEVTPKTQLDVKGGALIKVKSKMQLLERAQVASEDVAMFEDISTFQLFNTNNIWVHLPTLYDLLTTNKLQLPTIVNKKNIDGTDCIQLETAMGSAISCIEGASAICVARDRFYPVKKTSDLLLLRSDLFKQNEAGRLYRVTPNKSLPKINLSKEYDSLAYFENVFKEIPSLQNVTSLTIKGPQKINKSLVLDGDEILSSPRK